MSDRISIGVSDSLRQCIEAIAEEVVLLILTVLVSWLLFRPSCGLSRWWKLFCEFAFFFYIAGPVIESMVGYYRK